VTSACAPAIAIRRIAPVEGPRLCIARAAPAKPRGNVSPWSAVYRPRLRQRSDDPMAGLRTYRAKRDFTRTREPRGGAVGGGGHLYVIQKHAARRLHYDLRLELDGVLKSWAVTRGPSLVPGEKRLAVEVEDHPLDYAGFEGTIPQGEYGGGSVIVWDRGTWTPIGDPHKGLAKGHLDFRIAGEKLEGEWHLVRMRRRPGETRSNWLLIKAEDDAARPVGAPDILEERPESVLSGQGIEEIGGDGKPRRRAKARGAGATRKAAARLPDFVEPCLARLERAAPKGKGWVHEVKFDGYRLQARIVDGAVRLLTRTGLDWTRRFGTAIAKALGALKTDGTLIDGEVVVEGEAGASDFSALQDDLSAGRSGRFVYYAFDLLFRDGVDWRARPLVERKAALAELVPPGETGRIRYSEHFEEDGALFLSHACRLSLEGIVSKRRDAPYRSGRTGDWVKTKCAQRQEFVIAGYVPSTTGRKAIGSLVLGYHDKGKLTYAGRVGTGFSQRTARALWTALEARRIDAKPFAQTLSADELRGVRWAKPELVAEIEFRGWTGARNLRHASFHGLREDKPAAEIVREEPGEESARPSRKASSAVRLTHPDRVYWADAGLTKQGLADYYADAWRWIAPHIVGRPLSLVRCPDGTAGQCFFQKQPWKGLHSSIAVIDNPGAGGDQVMAIRDLDGLIALVQMAVLEIHPWGATVEDLDRPDRLVFDLDPGEKVAWPRLVEGAQEVRQRLDDHGLRSFLKTTGGKGLHVVVPLRPDAGWDAAKAFARGLAEAMTADAPDRYLAKATKAARSGRIFVDYLRNGRGATAVAPYSTRARPGAPVAVPLAWEELGPDVRADHFRVATVINRLTRLARDPWAGFLKLKQTLPAQPGTPRKRRRS